MKDKETAQGSFLKFTTSIFKKILPGNDIELLKYVVNVHSIEYEFWQRDSLAVHLYSMQVML
ncbi:MAG: hypothetical protein H7320_05855 [Ferruginibacter sp.]|nr:hypothetical protein [Ferruginibacter sp.]